MNPDATTQEAILTLVLLAGITALYWKLLPRLFTKINQRLGPWERAFLALWVGVMTLAGSPKVITPQKAMITLITALRSGGYVDPSGRVGAESMLAVSRQMTGQAKTLAQAASNELAWAEDTFAGLALALTTTPYQVTYIAFDVPRSVPNVLINHNISATFEYVEQAGDRVFGYVWYSQEPTIEPQVAMEYNIGNGWRRLTSVTNSYPDTVDINGADCVRYEFALPEEARGIPLRPDYELGLGGPSGLRVPVAGVSVEDDEKIHLPYTGWDHYSEDLSVRYLGGMAVEAVYMGTNYTGKVVL